MRILIIRLSSFGDIILTEPITTVLRKIYPAAEIDFLTNPQYATLPRMFPNINTVYIWNKDRESIEMLRKRNYDLVLDLHGKLQSFFFRFQLKAPRSITYKKKHNLRYKIVKKLTTRAIASTTELYASVLDNLGFPYHLQRPVLIPLRQKDPLMEDTFKDKRESKHTYIGVFPGANHVTKIYPLERLSAVLLNLPEEWKICYVFLGGPKEKKINEVLCKQMKYPSVDLTGQLDYLNLANIVNELDIVISMDSGPMHLAASLGKPQVAIFGSTHTKLGFAPQNQKAIVLQKNLACQPCSLHGTERCPKGHFKCMNLIEPQDVISAVVELYDMYVKKQPDNLNETD